MKGHAAPPLLAALRAATAADHERLEDISYGAQIQAQTLDRAQYDHLLRWQQHAHRELEPGLHEFREGDYQYRPRFPPHPGTPPASPPSRAIALGTVYVLDGASLGATLILQRLRQTSHLRAAAPFTFYERQAEWGLRQWRSFMRELNSLCPTAAEIDESCRAARRAFQCFEQSWYSSK